MRTATLPWTLTELQTEIYESKSRWLVLVAGRRFGKTVLSIAWLVSEVVARGRGALGYYVAPYRVMAKAIAWDMLLHATRGWRVAYNQSELSVTLPGDRKIVLKGADDPETLEGVGLVAVVLDEVGRMKLAAWEKSLRPALSDKKGRALLCGKPRGHNHLKDFYQFGQPGSTRREGWASWLYTTAQGGFVDSADIAEAKGSLPDRIYRQEYEATFESLAGRVYADFSRRRHVVSHAELEKRYQVNGRWTFKRIIVGVDWGLTNPGVMIVMGITSTGRVVAIHEEHHAGVLVSEMGWLRIGKQLRDTYHPERFVADPSEPGNIKALRLALGGNPVVENAHNEVAEGIRRVSIKQLDVAGQEPQFLISDTCTNTIREIEGYVWREVAGVTAEEPVKANDHCMDAMRYAVAALTR